MLRSIRREDQASPERMCRYQVLRGTMWYRISGCTLEDLRQRGPGIKGLQLFLRRQLAAYADQTGITGVLGRTMPRTCRPAGKLKAQQKVDNKTAFCCVHYILLQTFKTTHCVETLFTQSLICWSSRQRPDVKATHTMSHKRQET